VKITCILSEDFAHFKQKIRKTQKNLTWNSVADISSLLADWPKYTQKTLCESHHAQTVSQTTVKSKEKK